jgi:hypothetical protein
MATSTLIQYLSSSGVTGLGASTSFGTTPSDRKQVETFLFTNPNAVGGASITLTSGAVMALDVSKMATDSSGGLTALYVVPADYNSATVQKLVVGCIEIGSASASAGTLVVAPQETVSVNVVVRGPVKNVPVVGAAAVGDPLILDPAGATSSCAAQLPYNSASAALVSEAFAFALTVPAAGFLTAYVLGKGI